MTYNIRFSAEPLRSVAFGALGVAFIGFGAALEHPARQLILQNFTDANLIASFDGLIEHVMMKSNSCLILDITANKTSSEGFYLAQGERLYIKTETAVMPTLGGAYVSVFYGEND